MINEMTCIICPRGCELFVKTEEKGITVTGNSCPKGKKYAINECTNPMRTVTSSVRVKNREDTMVSVKTESPIPKDKIFELMKEIRKINVCAPIGVGDIIIKNIFNTNVIATKSIL